MDIAIHPLPICVSILYVPIQYINADTIAYYVERVVTCLLFGYAAERTATTARSNIDEEQ